MALLIALLLHWLPLWRRQHLWFGVTVPAGFVDTPAGRTTLARYRLSLWTITSLAIVCLLVGARWHAVPLFPIALLGQTFGASVTFAVVRRSVLPFAAQPS